MVGRSVMFTPKGLSVFPRVSRMASRNASGLGWVSAVRMPADTLTTRVRCEVSWKNLRGCVRSYRDLLRWKPLRRERAPRPYGNNLVSCLLDYNSRRAITIAYPLE